MSQLFASGGQSIVPSALASVLPVNSQDCLPLGLTGLISLQSKELSRLLLLGKNVMTNLESVLKSRDITLPTKVHIVKAMVFLIVMY